MKVVIILTLVAWTQAAKLEKAYLPPSARAQSAGGSSNFLQTPLSGSSVPTAFEAGNGFPDEFGPTGNDFAPSAFADNGNGYAQPGNGFAQSGNVYAQSGKGAQSGNGYAQSGNGYAQSGNGYAQSSNGYSQSGNFRSFETKPERAQAAFERNAAILRQSGENNVDSYSYAFETENGIRAEENGIATHGTEAQGGFSYTGDDGKVYSVRYTADQNGFVPQGDHLPTPPPIPEEILKALEQNAREEAQGIYDDGQYKEANNYAEGNGYPSNGNYNPEGGNDDDSVVTNNALLRNFPEAQGPSFGNQAEKAYLPPFAGNSQNGFGRRSFNARDGYRY